MTFAETMHRLNDAAFGGQSGVDNYQSLIMKDDLRELISEYQTLDDYFRNKNKEDKERREFGCHGLDTPTLVCFYEQDFYPLSNFSSFCLDWMGRRFYTLEHAYHWMKFASHPAGMERHPEADLVADCVRKAPSAHEAFQFAQTHKDKRRPDWDDVKVAIMRQLIAEKASQHEYVKRKLLATGDRLLVENSWRDDFWGWGENRNGQNMLGRLWMDLRRTIRDAESAEGFDSKRHEAQVKTYGMIYGAPLKPDSMEGPSPRTIGMSPTFAEPYGKDNGGNL